MLFAHNIAQCVNEPVAKSRESVWLHKQMQRGAFLKDGQSERAKCLDGLLYNNTDTLRNDCLVQRLG